MAYTVSLGEKSNWTVFDDGEILIQNTRTKETAIIDEKSAKELYEELKKRYEKE